MFSVFEAPDKKHEPNSRSRTVLYEQKAFTKGSRACAWSGTINIATSETGNFHIMVYVTLLNCRK